MAEEKKAKRSWKTTLCGIGALLVVIGGVLKALLDGDPSTVVDWEVVSTGILGGLAGLGLMAARDNKVSSEDAGAKPPEE